MYHDQSMYERDRREGETGEREQCTYMYGHGDVDTNSNVDHPFLHWHAACQSSPLVRVHMCVTNSTSTTPPRNDWYEHTSCTIVRAAVAEHFLGDK